MDSKSTNTLRCWRPKFDKMVGQMCLTCGRNFAARQCYIQHFKYKKNVACSLNLKLQLKGMSPITPPNEEPIAKRQKGTTKTARRTLNMDEAELKQQQQHPGISTTAEEHQQSDDEDQFWLPDDDSYVIPTPDVPLNLPIPPVMPRDEGVNPEKEAQRSKIMKDFKEYVNDSVKNRCFLDRDTRAGLELLDLLHKNGALALYDRLMDWHIAHLDAQKRVTKQQLTAKLRKRYNMEGCKPHIVKVTLPSSGVKAKIPCHDAWSMLQDLLTDPQICQEDYLWFDQNPLGEPPAEWLELRDITDGLAYRKTYEREILPKRYTESGRPRVLLPIITYMDGCVTGWNENLQIEFMKFTLGIFKSKARDKNYTWRNLGAVPQFQKVKAKAFEMMEKSTHLDAQDYLTESESEDEDKQTVRCFTKEFEFGQYIDSDEEEEIICNVQVPESESQDLHVILQVIMSGMKEILAIGGFDWDHVDQNGSIISLHYVPFFLFMKGDTVEHDKMTGHYGARTKGVKCLCRYCTCPADQTDDPCADFPRKSPRMMTELVRKKDMDGLKAISQQCLFNVWYEFGFGLHNDLGIHGACPMELLHWIQLGWYKYSRSALYDQFGQTSELANSINRIAVQMGWLFQRQSDKALPRTKFSKGGQNKGLHAHQMSGVMLVLAATLRSTQGRHTILATNNNNFPNQRAVDGWILLLESQMQFEAWLKSDHYSVSAVIRLRTKIRELMELIKAVGKRTKGMGYKTNNFHATKHVPDDILMFGPAHCVNSMSNEMHHKPDKKTAQTTQKRPSTFDFQCAERVEDRRCIEMGLLELTGKPRWDYFKGFNRQNQQKVDQISTRKRKSTATSPQQRANLTGVRSVFAHDEEKEGYTYRVNSAMKRKHKFKYPQYIIDFVADLAEELAKDADDLPGFSGELTIFSELLVETGNRYRAAPFFKGKPWYDWVMCRVGEQIEGFQRRIVPIHIRFFVDLTFLPPNNPTRYNPTLYLVGEPTRLNPDASEIEKSDMFVPHLKQEGNGLGNKLTILPVDDIVDSACVIPDLGHPSGRAYFRVRPAKEWSNLFENWLNSPLERDHQEPNIGE